MCKFVVSFKSTPGPAPNGGEVYRSDSFGERMLGVLVPLAGACGTPDDADAGADGNADGNADGKDAIEWLERADCADTGVVCAVCAVCAV